MHQRIGYQSNIYIWDDLSTIMLMQLYCKIIPRKRAVVCLDLIPKSNVEIQEIQAAGLRTCTQPILIYSLSIQETISIF